MKDAKAFLIFPHQMFKSVFTLPKDTIICLVEEARFFHEFPFHKQKLLLHRASMQALRERLLVKGYEVLYFPASKRMGLHDVATALRRKKVTQVAYYDVVDHVLSERIEIVLAMFTLESRVTPAFITDLAWGVSFFEGRQLKMASFYQEQRRRLSLLVDDLGNPEGGRWNLDADRWEKLPEGYTPPDVTVPDQPRYVEEAVVYVEKYFKKNPGTLEAQVYPVTHSDAEDWLDDFFEHRLKDSGKYLHVMSATEAVLHHSLISPLLNNGLLTPELVITRLLRFRRTTDIPLASLEGFIQQLIGGREYTRLVYEISGELLRDENPSKAKRQVPTSLWSGSAALLPVDVVANRVHFLGYAHTGERQRIIGAYLTMLGVHPHERYHWEMSMYVDTYDWNVVPHVYGLAPLTDEETVSPVTQLVESKDIVKMSNFPVGEWCETWDALLWSYVEKHSALLDQMSRLAMLVKRQAGRSSDDVSESSRRARQHISAVYQSS